jgi:hypothetical protein
LENAGYFVFRVAVFSPEQQLFPKNFSKMVTLTNQNTRFKVEDSPLREAESGVRKKNE